MPTYTIRDPQTGRTMRVRGDSPPTEAELSELFGSAPSGPSSQPAERTWGDTFTDALPLAGGIVGGIVGTPGGIPGIMAGSAVGGGLGEAARQRVRGEDMNAGDIASTAIGEGLTAGAFGLAGKGAARIIRGVRNMGTAPGDVVTGVFKNLPGSSMVKGIGRETEARLEREALGKGRLNKGRVENLDNVLEEALNEVRSSPTPNRVGGSGSPLRAKNNLPVVNPEQSGGMISTQPDKWGATSIHQAEDFIDRSRLVDRARPVQKAALADDAFARNIKGDPQRQQLVRELLRAEAPEDLGGRLTTSGRSMFTPEEASMFENALRELRSGSLNRAQSVKAPLAPRAIPDEAFPESWRQFIRR